MDSRLLKTFRAVVQEGSVSGGAKILHLTQPAVSKQLKKLEDSLNLKLFQRTPSGIGLTPAGETLNELSGDILSRISRAEDLLKARFSTDVAFQVATPNTTASVLIAPFMAETNPPIADLFIVPAPEVDALLNKEADLGISTMHPPLHRQFHQVASLPLRVQAPEASFRQNFGSKESIEVNQLHSHEVLAPKTGVHTALASIFSNAPASRSITVVASGRVAQALALNGHGIAVVTEEPDFGLTSKALTSHREPVSIPLFASWDPNHYAKLELEELVENFSAWMAKHLIWGIQS